MVSAKNSQGDTILHLAVLSGNKTLAERLFQVSSLDISKDPTALIDASIVNKDGETAYEL